MDTLAPSPVSVAFTPVYPNPYQRLLGDALAVERVTVEMMPTLPSLEWLRENAGSIHWLHLHWLSGLYMQRYRTPLSLASFWRWLDTARELGYSLAWTAHNIYPHRPGLERLHAVVRRRVLQEADLVIAHCTRGADLLRTSFGIDRAIEVVPIGTYASTFPLQISRSTARQRLGLAEEQFVYLSLGNIAPYKGLGPYTQLFLQSAGPDDVALIAGRNRDSTLVKTLEQVATSDHRLHIQAGFIPDVDLQIYLRAADVLVAPFSRILTSASVMIALDAGLPVIVPRLGCLETLVTPDAGIIYDPDVPEGLSNSLHEIKRRDLAAMSRAATARAASFRWETIAQQTAALYRTHLSTTRQHEATGG